MRRSHGILATLSAGLLVAALAPMTVAQSPAADPLADTVWLLGTVGGTPVPSGTNATLIFGQGNAGGFAGCNQFFGDYTTDGTSSLKFGPLSSTMIFCDDATNAFEQSYLAALASVASYANTDAGLDLSDSSGTVVLSYSATPPATVEGPWNVTGVNNGAEAVVSPPADVAASFAFHPDGTIEGFGGCNGFGGGYSVDGDSIAIGPLMSTMMSCGDETDTFEQQLLTALQAATVWSVTAGALELRDDAGALQVGASSAIGH